MTEIIARERFQKETAFCVCLLERLEEIKGFFTSFQHQTGDVFLSPAGLENILFD